jgi:hypothetical protein
MESNAVWKRNNILLDNTNSAGFERKERGRALMVESGFQLLSELKYCLF